MITLAQIHPMIVHFPIVFGLSLATFDVISLLAKKSISGRGAIANISAALAVLTGLAAVVAAYFGDMALDIAIAKGGPADALNFHGNLGSTTATVLGIWAALRALGWWRKVRLDGARGTTVALLELVFCAMILVTAFYGGELVFAHGVAVTR